MSQSVITKKAWCPHCGVRHDPDTSCPSSTEIRAPERLAWQSVYETPGGPERIGVFVAPTDAGWRARIVTHPKVVWAIPGGACAMKFLGATPTEAREAATGFVRDETTRRLGYTRLPDADAAVATDEPTRAAPRKLHRINARWGIEYAQQPADTGNLSKTGMFLVTDRPPEPGSPIQVRLDADACSIPLRGRVVWARPTPEGPLPPGMGIQLVRPPAVYVDYVQRLA